MILEQLLKPFLALLKPLISHVNLPGGGGGSRPAKAALAEAAKGDPRRKFVAEQKAKRLAQLRAPRQRGTALAGSRSAAARAQLRKP